MKIRVVMLAAGQGSRMNAAVNKVFLTIEGKTVIRRSCEAFLGLADEIMIVCRKNEEEQIMSEIAGSGISCPVRFASGGKTRQESVRNGLSMLCCDPDDIILIHDAARCLVDQALILRVIDSCKQYGTGIPAVPACSTFKICDDRGVVVHTPDRSHLYEIQTPQGFRAETILPFSERAATDSVEGTDDASLLEHYGIPVRTVKGSTANIKLTSPGDLVTAGSILKGASSSMRIGMGYDVHRLVPGRQLILCGIVIPFELGLLGHSDADVALHALMDAMLGACAMGDIGSHYPDTDPRYSGISSIELLKETCRLIAGAGFRVHNLDITIVAQKPKLLPYVPRMIEKVAGTLGIDRNSVSIKATTTEKLGFEGRLEGISSYAVCTVEQNGQNTVI